MAISSSSPSSGDWSLASFLSCRKPHKTLKLQSSFSIPTWNVRAFQVINSSSCPSPILEDQASTNLPDTEVDLKFQELQIPDAEDSLNEFLCGLFHDPETEAMGYEQYAKAKKVANFRPNKSTLEHATRLVISCIRARKFKIARTLLEVFKSDGDVALSAFNSTMRGYNELHMYKSTISVFEKMISAGIGPDSGCYCRIMEAYFRKGDYRKVVELFQELKSEKLDLTPLSTQFLFKSLSKLGKPVEALEIFRSMSKEGISLDSSKIYSVLISSFATIREVKVAEELFKEAETKKMLRDPTVFLRLITMYVEEGLVDKTIEVVKVMKGANIRVSDNICCAVVSGFSRKSGLLTAAKVFEDLILMGCQAGQVTYASIINVYCRLGLHSKAEMVFKEMEAKGFDKCVVAYSSMVAMYGKTGRPRDAMKLVAKMKERGCKPNVWIYNSLMDMHGRDNNMRQVAKLWSEMKRRKVSPDKVSYTTVIGAYNKAGDFDMCLRYYNEYRTHGGALDKAMAGMMVGVFSKSGRVDELVKLLRDMKEERTGLDVRLYRSALNALADSGMEMQVKWFQSSFEVT
ncbi:pentatricopeptide repeat-containing protein At5g13770, chloroplastic [Argentina anserina]|uniref:pentatricopeptide repeat-containing protein At5g13770, chloroplastic n=1 Tax=Argentina anserina TaxID=57926 RepID=UPI0021763FAB|nr:pentatricopeptide repeat-containing protein At5g13770, chloroplastic [Potentilla anserina]